MTPREYLSAAIAAWEFETRDNFVAACTELFDLGHGPALLAALDDAERYRWLREQTWDRSALCVVTDAKETVRLGTYCPSGELLDAAIDAARKA